LELMVLPLHRQRTDGITITMIKSRIWWCYHYCSDRLRRKWWYYHCCDTATWNCWYYNHSYKQLHNPVIISAHFNWLVLLITWTSLQIKYHANKKKSTTPFDSGLVCMSSCYSNQHQQKVNLNRDNVKRLTKWP
jgi:hypothetical protein